METERTRRLNWNGNNWKKCSSSITSEFRPKINLIPLVDFLHWLVASTIQIPKFQPPLITALSAFFTWKRNFLHYTSPLIDPARIASTNRTDQRRLSFLNANHSRFYRCSLESTKGIRFETKPNHNSHRLVHSRLASAGRPCRFMCARRFYYLFAFCWSISDRWFGCFLFVQTNAAVVARTRYRVRSHGYYRIHCVPGQTKLFIIVETDVVCAIKLNTMQLPCIEIASH